MTNTKKTVLAGLTLEEMQAFVAKIDESKFRGQQLYNWIYKKSASSFQEMTDLAKSFREKLEQVALITSTQVVQRQVSEDGTIKYLLEFADGQKVETVLMRFDNRSNLTACVSSQVGCPVQCAFCATGELGFVRNLTAQEIVEQILVIQRDTGLKVTNIVYMGQGEPLMNYNEVIKSISIANDGLEIGIRRITISTSGVVPGIRRLVTENRQLTLALSLHASNHEIRKELIPLENKYPIDKVIEAMKYLSNNTGRRVTIEYLMIEDVNDQPEHAKELIYLLKNLNCNINLIPYNSLGNDKYRKPSRKRINDFRYILDQSGRKCTVRLERGSDIDAACGQLSGKQV